MRRLPYYLAPMVVALLTLLLTVRSEAEPLLWPTPEGPGVVRDLTHTPDLPFFPMEPDHLQHQMWAQPRTTPMLRTPIWIPPPAVVLYPSIPERPPSLAERAADRALAEFERMK